jgi:hypothetical protein
MCSRGLEAKKHILKDDYNYSMGLENEYKAAEHLQLLVATRSIVPSLDQNSHQSVETRLKSS